MTKMDIPLKKKQLQVRQHTPAVASHAALTQPSTTRRESGAQTEKYDTFGERSKPRFGSLAGRFQTFMGAGRRETPSESCASQEAFRGMDADGNGVVTVRSDPIRSDPIRPFGSRPFIADGGANTILL